MLRITPLMIVVAATGCQSASPVRQIGQPAAEASGTEPIQLLAYQAFNAAGATGPDKLVHPARGTRYDVYCLLFPNQPSVYRDCRVLGFTDDGPEKSFSSKSAGAYRHGWFQNWLALEMSDGRMAYIPGDTVRYIEESTGRATAEPTGESAMPFLNEPASAHFRSDESSANESPWE